MSNQRGATEVLHKSESGICEHRINSTAISYAGQLARYISNASTIRARVLEQYDLAPTIEHIRELQDASRRQRNKYREAWEALGERPEDHVEFRVGTFVRPERGRPVMAPYSPRVTNSDEQTSAEPHRPFTQPILPEDVIAGIAAEFNVSVADIKGPRKFRTIMLARRVAAYVLHKRGNSYPAIGARLGGRDHSSIIHAKREFEAKATPKMREVAARYVGDAA